MKITLPLASVDIDGVAPVRQRVLFAGTFESLGRVALELKIGGWAKLGRPTDLTVSISTEQSGGAD